MTSKKFTNALNLRAFYWWYFVLPKMVVGFELNMLYNITIFAGSGSSPGCRGPDQRRLGLNLTTTSTRVIS